MTVTVPLNEMTGMWRHSQWCEILQKHVFLQSVYRPGEALTVPGCQPYTLGACTSKEIYLVFTVVIGRDDCRAIVRLEGLFQRKIPINYRESNP